MAPILKQLFRGAGEGTFTNQDQELLIAMLPTRKDTPEARIIKVQNIDAIVRAKLNARGTSQAATQTPAVTPSPTATQEDLSAMSLDQLIQLRQQQGGQ
jgi:hypothetical protein